MLKGGAGSFTNFLLFALLTPVEDKVVFFLQLVVGRMPGPGPSMMTVLKAGCKGPCVGGTHGASWSHRNLAYRFLGGLLTAWWRPQRPKETFKHSLTALHPRESKSLFCLLVFSCHTGSRTWLQRQLPDDLAACCPLFLGIEKCFKWSKCFKGP